MALSLVSIEEPGVAVFLISLSLQRFSIDTIQGDQAMCALRLFRQGG